MKSLTFCKQLLLVVCLCCISFQAHAQNRQDAIKKFQEELKTDLSDSLRVATYFKIAATYRFVSSDSAFHYANITREEAKKIGMDLYQPKIDNLMGSLHLDLSDRENASYYFHRALKYFKDIGNEISMGISYNKLSVLHRNTYNLDSALYYNVESLKIFDKYKRLRYSLHARNNIANIYNVLGDKEKALESHEEILKIRDSINDVRGKMHSYGNLGDIYGDLENFDKAFDYYTKGIAICIEIQDSVSLARFYNNRAAVYTQLEELDKALSEYKLSKNIREKYNDLYGVASTSLSLAKIQFMKRQYSAAHRNLAQSIAISKQNDLKDFLADGYDMMSRAKLIRREHDSAFHYQRLAEDLRLKISGEEIKQEVAEVETKYQTEKKEKELLQTKAEKATTELNLTQQRQLTYGLFAGLALLLLLGYSLFQRNKRKHALSIAQQKEEGLQAIIQAEENERTKIARELHDGVVQQIGSVILKSRSILENLKAIDQPESKELLKSLEDSNQDLRNISHQMMPRALNELGIVAALQDLLEGSLGLVNIESKFEHFNISERLPQKVEITIYRVVQELINNIIKHSKATEVSVQLFKTGNDAILIVEDNGVGMSDTKAKKGIGLLNISSRLDMVNGHVNFEPSPQSGTLVTIKIPV